MPITKLKFRQLRLNSVDFTEDSSSGEIQLADNAVTTEKIKAMLNKICLIISFFP